jgi:hypothetical protein
LNTALPISSINGALSGNGISFLTASSSTGLIDFVSSDKGCLPVVLGDSTSNSASLSTLSQTSSKTLQIVYASAAIGASEPGTCPTATLVDGTYTASTYTADTCVATGTGATCGCASVTASTCSSSSNPCGLNFSPFSAPAVTTTGGNCGVSYTAAAYSASSFTGITCTGGTLGSFSCSTTVANGNTLSLNVANDLISVWPLFCSSSGSCCITAVGATTPCNADPLTTTSFANVLRVNMNIIFFLSFVVSLLVFNL